MPFGLSSSDLLVILAGIVLGGLYLFKDQLFGSGASKSGDAASSLLAGKLGGASGANGGADAGNDRDFIAKMKATNKRIAIIFGSQTGTAEDYAVRLAKEAKSRFGLSSLVCDAEEYDYENLDQLPSDSAVFFVMATYGEGEPTDNAVQLLQNLTEDDFAFSNGEHKLEGVRYVVFGLGNRTYEHYNKVARQVDDALEKAGAQRIGTRGEGDDDKSMEEDYLAWKDGMWEEFSKVMGVEEGSGGDTKDFVVSELDAVEQTKVYLGELSARALNKTKGIHDIKNPFAAPIVEIKELFQSTHDRNCIHVEFGIDQSGMTYQHGDHVGIWPSNQSLEVTRLLHALGLYSKREAVIGIESLDPTLAKVPFPVPTTYETVLRHYLDISSVAGRQAINSLAKYAPNEDAQKLMELLGSDKEAYNERVAKPCLKLGEVLQLAAGDVQRSSKACTTQPDENNTSQWTIPFDVIVSAIPRLGARYYSISSSPKIYPQSIHVTCVVLKYQNVPDENTNPEAKWVFGVGSNYLLNLKNATANGALLANGNGNGHAAGTPEPEAKLDLAAAALGPSYDIKGPRGKYFGEKIYKAPIHVRRSTFRLPTNPKTPVLMIGPGTGVAPFRGFVQERVALARKAIEKNGPDALSTWGPMRLYYGCRRSTEDYLYASEWPEFEKELGGRFTMRTAFSRETPGKKVYVQTLMTEDKDLLKEMVYDKKGYVYICGDARSMSKAVEEVLARVLAEAVGKPDQIEEGFKEIKTMKERGRLLTDTWS